LTFCATSPRRPPFTAEVIDSVPLPGHDRFEFRDPFGNRVEFIQRR
jgi:hypothetical protein